MAKKNNSNKGVENPNAKALDNNVDFSNVQSNNQNEDLLKVLPENAPLENHGITTADYAPSQRDSEFQSFLQSQQGAFEPQMIDPNLTNQDLMPTLGRRINKGSYSGSVVGSVPIFSSGSPVVPWSAIQKRKVALQQAAEKATIQKKQEAQRQAGKAASFAFAKSPEAQGKQFQKSINTAWDATYNKYQDLSKQYYGDDWVDMLGDSTDLGQAMRAELEGIEMLVSQGNEVVGAISQLDPTNSNVIMTEEAKSLKMDFDNMLGDFENGDYTKLATIGEKMSKFYVLKSISTAVGAVELTPEKTGGASVVNEDGIYKIRTSNKENYDGAIETMADTIFNEQYASWIDKGYKGFENKDTVKAQIKAQLKAKYPNSSTSKLTVQQEKGSGGNKNFTVNDVEDIIVQDRTFTDSKGNKVDARGAEIYMEVNPSADITVYDPATGKTSTVTSQGGTIGSLFVKEGKRYVTYNDKVDEEVKAEDAVKRDGSLNKGYTKTSDGRYMKVGVNNWKIVTEESVKNGKNAEAFDAAYAKIGGDSDKGILD